MLETAKLTQEQETLRAAFRAALEESGVTQAVVAEKCGVTPQAVHGWLKTGKIARKHLTTISILTNWSVLELLTNRRGGSPDGDMTMTLSPDERDLVLAYQDISDEDQLKLRTAAMAMAEQARALVRRILLERMNITDYVPDKRVAKAFKRAPPGPSKNPK